MGKRGIPDMWDEVKGRISLTVTPTGVKGLDKVAESMNLSRSELIEQIGRGLLRVVKNEDAQPEQRDALAASKQPSQICEVDS